MADLVVSDGYQDVGYSYVNIDDCWLAHERDRFGRLQPDHERFPSGIKALGEYVSQMTFLMLDMFYLDELYYYYFKKEFVEARRTDYME